MFRIAVVFSGQYLLVNVDSCSRLDSYRRCKLIEVCTPACDVDRVGKDNLESLRSDGQPLVSHLGNYSYGIQTAAVPIHRPCIRRNVSSVGNRRYRSYRRRRCSQRELQTDLRSIGTVGISRIVGIGQGDGFDREAVAGLVCRTHDYYVALGIDAGTLGQIEALILVDRYTAFDCDREDCIGDRVASALRCREGIGLGIVEVHIAALEVYAQTVVTSPCLTDSIVTNGCFESLRRGVFLLVVLHFAGVGALTHESEEFTGIGEEGLIFGQQFVNGFFRKVFLSDYRQYLCSIIADLGLGHIQRVFEIRRQTREGDLTLQRNLLGLTESYGLLDIERTRTTLVTTNPIVEELGVAIGVDRREVYRLNLDALVKRSGFVAVGDGPCVVGLNRCFELIVLSLGEFISSGSIKDDVLDKISAIRRVNRVIPCSRWH